MNIVSGIQFYPVVSRNRVKYDYRCAVTVQTSSTGEATITEELRFSTKGAREGDLDFIQKPSKFKIKLSADQLLYVYEAMRFFSKKLEEQRNSEEGST